MQHHVFAVWDFMSLLKRLQRDVTCVSIPWVPSKFSPYARFINEIVLGEESDEDARGGYASHFELYLDAMKDCGADTAPIESFLDELRKGRSVEHALSGAPVAESVKEFVRSSLHFALEGQPHEVCAAFFYGREDIIPEMFQQLLEDVGDTLELQRFRYYLHRHIELDQNQHGPLAQRLLAALCDGDPIRQAEAEEAAARSLQARIQLWNGVVKEIGR